MGLCATLHPTLTLKYLSLLAPKAIIGQRPRSPGRGMTPDSQEPLSGWGNPLIPMLKTKKDCWGPCSLHGLPQQSHHSQSKGGNKKAYACVRNWPMSVSVSVSECVSMCDQLPSPRAAGLMPWVTQGCITWLS